MFSHSMSKPFSLTKMRVLIIAKPLSNSIIRYSIKSEVGACTHCRVIIGPVCLFVCLLLNGTSALFRPLVPELLVVCLFAYKVLGPGVTNRLLLKVLTSLDDVKQTQKLHSTMLQSIIGNLHFTNCPSVDLPDEICLPMEILQDVDSVENQIQDSTTKKVLVS